MLAVSAIPLPCFVCFLVRMEGFDHERLHVYGVAREYNLWLHRFLRDTRVVGWGSLVDQLRRTGASIPLNIAEGSGEFSPGEKNRFFRIAKRSAAESAAALDHMEDVGIAAESEINDGKLLLHRIVCMLVRLIQSNERPREPEPPAP